MNESKQRGREVGGGGVGGLEVGDGVNVDDVSAEWWRGGGGGGGSTECRLPFTCPSCVEPVREQGQCR